jgi:glycosyltransferase involved in cell wall biosynthesis
MQVGAICERKGQHVMARAFVKAASRGGAPAFGLVFLGWGRPEDVARVRQILAEAPARWREAVRFSVFESQDFSLMDAADVVVHPSTFHDAFPNAVREAMILGKPVIASRVGGLPDMIVDGETGLLVPAGDAEALSGAILRLIGDPERRRQLGGRAAMSATRNFDIDLRKVAYLDLFNRVCRASVRS